MQQCLVSPQQKCVIYETTKTKFVFACTARWSECASVQVHLSRWLLTALLSMLKIFHFIFDFIFVWTDKAVCAMLRMTDAGVKGRGVPQVALPTRMLQIRTRHQQRPADRQMRDRHCCRLMLPHLNESCHQTRAATLLQQTMGSACRDSINDLCLSVKGPVAFYILKL